jgi:medium-chain acyl-[acyl-carrier-protein] hydrolase
LPAREDRLKDEPYPSFAALADDVATAIFDSQIRDYALLGHSMGSYAAFEVARRIAASSAPQPAALVVTGSTAPQLVHRTLFLHELPDEQFLAELAQRYDGIPAAVAADDRLLKLVLPVLRADMRLVETYQYVAAPPLAINLLALGGLDDPGLIYQRLAAWGELTSGEFVMQLFAGGHFFLHPSREATAHCPPAIATIVDFLAKVWSHHEPSQSWGHE